MAEVASPRKVVLVTDPGRDIDDVVTLITLAGANFTFPGEPADPSKYELVGIVTSGGAALKRACVARGWMRLLGVSDELPIAASEEVDGIGKLACFFPAGFPTPASAALCTASEEGITPATELIVSLAERHGSDLALWCIAPLTPLALAISDYGGADGRGAAALRSIGALFVQGQALIAGDAEESGAAPGTLVPSAECFNLREDMASAHAVFQAVQDVVPIRMLGKFAAYRVSIFRADFNAFDAPLRDAGYLDDSGRSSDAFEAGEGEGGAAGGEGAAVATAIPALLQAAKNNLNIFRTGNPTLFYSIYPVPLAEQNDEEWFNSIGASCVSGWMRGRPLAPPCLPRLRLRWPAQCTPCARACLPSPPPLTPLPPFSIHPFTSNLLSRTVQTSAATRTTRFCASRQ